MARFVYQARSANGQVQTGQLEAATEQEAASRLRSKQLTPLRLVKAGGVTKAKSSPAGSKPFFRRGVKSRELQIFTRQFSTLINAGIPIVDSLQILAEGKGNQALKDTVSSVKTSIEGGKRLGDAMGAHPAVFSRFFVNMVRAGEEAGILDTILMRMSQYMEKAEKLKKQIKGAMVYPGAIVSVAVIVVVGILVFIIPRFQDLYKSAHKDLPALTQMVVALSGFFIQRWYIVISAVVGVPWGLTSYYKSNEGRALFDRILIRSPIFGDLIQKSSVAKMSRTLSTLLSSGVSVVDALDIAAKTAGNVVIEDALVRSKEAVISGRPLAAPLAKEPMIPEMVTQMITIGEKSGTLDQMLGKIADFYEDDVENAVKAFTSLIEPILMVVLGAVIAVLVLAMYLPVFDMASTAVG
ncbi:MAG: type II secretion system F family protein [Bdellovibrio sp.]|nr:MAG: type II secretion system F family protein [Bdellovibrio sp.]